eukprot:s2850_g6.t1
MRIRLLQVPPLRRRIARHTTHQRSQCLAQLPPSDSMEGSIMTFEAYRILPFKLIIRPSKVPSQEDLRSWPLGGIDVKGRRCLPYSKMAQQLAVRKLHFVHQPVADLEVPGNEHLLAFTEDLEARAQQGEKILVHCMGGRGRSNLVAGCLLARLYDLSAQQVERRLQDGYDARNYDNCLVNRLLQVNLAKVEQCASGAIYCQIIDACHPASVAMRKATHRLTECWMCVTAVGWP